MFICCWVTIQLKVEHKYCMLIVDVKLVRLRILFPPFLPPAPIPQSLPLLPHLPLPPPPSLPPPNSPTPTPSTSNLLQSSCHTWQVMAYLVNFNSEFSRVILYFVIPMSNTLLMWIYVCIIVVIVFPFIIIIIIMKLLWVLLLLSSFSVVISLVHTPELEMAMSALDVTAIEWWQCARWCGDHLLLAF